MFLQKKMIKNKSIQLKKSWHGNCHRIISCFKLNVHEGQKGVIMKQNKSTMKESTSNKECGLQYQIIDSKKRDSIEDGGQIFLKPDNFIDGYRIIQNLNVDNHNELVLNPESKILSLVNNGGGIIANLEIVQSAFSIIQIKADNSSGKICLSVGEHISTEKIINFEQLDSEASSVTTKGV